MFHSAKLAQEATMIFLETWNKQYAEEMLYLFPVRITFKCLSRDKALNQSI
jgi:hypothetical protein